MRGRPIAGEEFDRMIEATTAVVDSAAAESWKLHARIRQMKSYFNHRFKRKNKHHFPREDEPMRKVLAASAAI